MIYFDNAATTGKKPIQVVKAVERAMIKYSANPGRSGHKVSQNTALAVYEVREKVADFFGADGPEQVVFTANCTHSLNCVIKGNLGVGDHVVVSDLEHNAVMRPIYKSGVRFDMAAVSFEDDNVTVENFKKLIKPNTKMIIATGASNVIGKVLPLYQIGQLCKENHIQFVVDAAQMAGVLPIDMQKMNIDFLCVAAHKGLYAPMGIGVLIARKPIENTILEGGTGTDSINFEQPKELPERLESGTINVPAICGVGAGIDFINSKGIKNIYDHEMHIISKIYRNLVNDSNFEIYTPDPQKHNYAPVLSLNFRDVDSGEISDYLDKKGIAVRAGLHCAPTAHKRLGTIESGTVRISSSIFNTNYDTDYLLRALKGLKNI